MFNLFRRKSPSEELIAKVKREAEEAPESEFWAGGSQESARDEFIKEEQEEFNQIYGDLTELYARFKGYYAPKPSHLVAKETIPELIDEIWRIQQGADHMGNPHREPFINVLPLGAPRWEEKSQMWLQWVILTTDTINMGN